MELIEQVCSLESAKRLKELGVAQESLFWWEKWTSWNEEQKAGFESSLLIYGHGSKKGLPDGYEEISAFTVAELGEILPARVEKDGEYYILIAEKHAKWQLKYVTYRNGIGFILDGYDSGSIQHTDTESNERAKMLIYLLENNLLAL